MLSQHAARFFLALSLFAFFPSAGIGQTSDWGHLSSSGTGYAMPPLHYENNHYVGLTFKTSPEIIRELVPEPLVVTQDSLMTMYVGVFNIVAPESITYHEAALLVPAAYDESTRGSYVPVMYLDRALPITMGRETWGFPKFEAEFSMTIADGVIKASVTKDGRPLMDVVLKLDEPVAPGRTRSDTFILRKTIPSVEGGGLYDVDQLVTAHTSDSKWTEVILGRAQLHFRSTPTDPLGKIPVLRVVSAAYIKSESTLGYGEVIYDYLSEQH
ncbi:MAG: acetoacetate decarboxylase family protein [bacterium]